MAATIPVQVVINAIDNAGKTLQGIGKNVTGVGAAMVAIGAAPTAALAYATKSAIDFESAFAGVRKTVDASEAEFAQLEKNIRQISKTTPMTAVELSRIGEMAGQLGVSGVGNLTNFIETISKIGVTTNMTSEEAATAFARISNIMQEPIQNVGRMGSVVVDLGNNMATTESEITDFASRIAGAGKIAGLTTAEVFSIGAAMSSVGIEAEAGGTAVQKVLIEMQRAATTGSDKLDSFAKVAGMSSKEFQKAFKEDAASAFQSFVEGIASRGEEATAVFQEIEMQDVRLIRSFLSLANAGDLLSDALKIGTNAWEENRAMVEEAEKRYATTESQMQIFRNNLQDIGITVGSVILPAINNMIKNLAPLITGFANFADKHPKLITGLLGIGAAIGTIGAVLIPLGMLISAASTLFGALAAAGSLVAGVMAGPVVASIAAVMVPLLPIIAIVAAIAAAIGLMALAWKNNWFDIQGKTKAAVDAITGFITGLVEGAKQTFANIKDAVTNGINSFIEGIQNAGNAIADWITRTIEGVKNFVSSVVTFIGSIPERLATMLSNAGQALYTFFFETIPYAIAFAVGMIVKFFAEDIPNAWNAFVEFLTVGVPALAEQFVTWITDMATRSWEAVVKFATVDIPAAITSMKDWLSTEIPALGQRIVNWFKEMGNNAWNAVVQLKDNAIATFKTLKTNAIELAQAIWQGVKDWFQKTVTDVTTAINNLPGNVAQAFNNAKERAISIAKEIYTGVKEWFDKIVGFFRDIVDWAGKAIGKAKEAASAGFEAGRRQFGGPVNTMNAVMVGEAGPEMFVPQTAGTIVPNHSLGKGGGGGTTIQFIINSELIINSPSERRNIAEALYKDLVELARSQNTTVADMMGG